MSRHTLSKLFQMEKWGSKKKKKKKSQEILSLN